MVRARKVARGLIGTGTAAAVRRLLRHGLTWWKLNAILGRMVRRSRRTAVVVADSKAFRKVFALWRRLSRDRQSFQLAMQYAWNTFIQRLRRTFLEGEKRRARINVRNENLMLRAIQSLSRRLSARGFRGLVAACAEQRAKRRRAFLSVKEWQNKGPRKPWFKWRAVAFCASTAARALRRLRYRGMAMGFAGWRDAIATSKRSIDLQQRGVATFLDKRSRLGLNSWIAYVEAQGETLRKLQRGVGAFVNRLLRHFWNSYTDIARQNVRKLRLMERALRKLAFRSQGRGFNSMREAWRSRRGALTSMSRAVAEWQNKGPIKPWLKWRRVARCRRQLLTGLRSTMHRGLRLGLNSWLDVVSARERAQELRRVSVSAFLDRRSRQGMNTWIEYCASAEEARRKLQRGVGAFLNRLLRHFWNSYTDIARQNVRKLRLMERALRKLAFRSQGRGFNSMREAWRSRRGALTSMSRAVACWQNKGLVRPWRTWNDISKLHGKRLSAVVCHVRHARRQGFRAIRRVAGERAWRLGLVSRAVRERGARRARIRLRAWLEYAKNRTASFVCLLRAVNSYRVRLLTRGVRGWQRHSERNEFRRRLWAMGIAGCTRGRCKRATLAWAKLTAVRLADAKVRRAAFSNLRRHMLGGGFRAWCVEFRSRRRRRSLAELKCKVEGTRLSVVYFHCWAQKRASTPGIHPKEASARCYSIPAKRCTSIP